MTDTLLVRTQAHIAKTYTSIIIDENLKSADVPDGTFLGSYAWSNNSKHIRFITHPNRQVAPGVFPADMARQYIKENYILPIRRRKDQKRKYILPLRAIPGLWDVDGIYLDVRAAYRRALELVGFDVDYRLGSYLSGDPKPLPEEFYIYKEMYQVIVGISANFWSSCAVKRDGIIKTQFFRNQYHNPCLYAFCSEFLASYAGDVIEGIPATGYFNTDGAIVPLTDAQQVINIASNYALDLSEKGVGETEIFGVGAYRVGDKHTRRMFARGMKTHQSALPTLHERAWMRKHVEFLARRYLE